MKHRNYMTPEKAKAQTPLMGRRVRMTQEYKFVLMGECHGCKHCYEDINDDCIHCQIDHLNEFGSCTGIVMGLTDYNNVPSTSAMYNINILGPDVDVRWEPSGLRYSYCPKDLEVVTGESS